MAGSRSVFVNAIGGHTKVKELLEQRKSLNI